VSHAQTPHLTLIRRSKGWAPLGLRDLWEYRELLHFLIWREIRSRYRQMALGPLWVLIIPLANMLIFTLISGAAGISTSGAPRPVFVYTGLVIWQLFSESARKSATSLVTQLPVISKVYFPRLLVPLSASLVGVADFIVALAALVALMLLYGVAPGAAVLALPLFAGLALASALGVGLWLAAVAVRFRDVAYGVNFLLQAWFFCSPVFYPAAIIQGPWRPLYLLNPMTHAIEGFRWCLGCGGQPPGPGLALACAGAAVLVFSGAWIFRRTERTVVDYV